MTSSNDADAAARTGRTGDARLPAPAHELLRTEGIRKSFPGVLALDGVDFALHAGEVHALLGENGAGKSTLIKVLAGVHRPDAGRVLRDGKPVRIRGAQDAERLGIATMHQEFTLVPHLSVAENIHLGRPPRRFGLVDRTAMHSGAAALLDRVGVDIPPGTPVRELGVAQRQMVEIAKALSLRARVLVMDEPTAALSAGEAERLFGIVRRLRGDGAGVVFITHHLEEIAALADRITVLRDGRGVGCVPADTPRDDLVRMMVGRDIERRGRRAGGVRRAAQRPYAGPSLEQANAETEAGAEAETDAETEVEGRPLLRVSGLGRAGGFADVGFVLHAGEVVGLAGLMGAGRTEVARAVFGADRYDTGSVEVCGERLPGHDVSAALSHGLGLVPEDRVGQGLVPGASVQENLGLVTLRAASRAGFVDRRGQRKEAARIAGRLGIRMTGLGQRVGTLSGGNQQKVAIGKWLLARSRVLILDEPTRGVDVGAKAEIHGLIDELTASGHAVLMISSDLPEVLGVSDRILVMAGGRIAGELAAEEATEDAVLALAMADGGEGGASGGASADGGGTGNGRDTGNSGGSDGDRSEEDPRDG